MLSYRLSNKICCVETKCLFFPFVSLSPGSLLLISTLTQFGNSLPKTLSLTEQTKLPNPTSDQTEDDLIPCPYDSRISYKRIWGTNVPVMDYDIFKLLHPFSMLVAGPRGAGKSEFVKQLLSLNCFIMMKSSRENCLVLW